MTFCEHLNRLLWLFDTITTYGPISLKDINRRWLRRTGSLDDKIDRQTFSREKTVIEEIFDVEIVIVERDKYVVKDPQHNVHKRLQKRMLANIHESNLLSNFKALGSSIRIPEIQKGTEYLYTIGEAMHESKILAMEYHKYEDKTSYIAEVEPYCLKLFSRRWYMFARKTVDQKIKCFSLDRVKSIELTDKKFEKNKDFDPDTYFGNYYGVYIGEVEPEEVLIRTTKTSMKYLLDLNMHDSQVIIDEHVATQMLSKWKVHYKKSSELTCYFKFYIAPTPDFENELIRLCENCEVLYPLWLREKLYKRMKKALSNMDEASNVNTNI